MWAKNDRSSKALPSLLWTIKKHKMWINFSKISFVWAITTLSRHPKGYQEVNESLHLYFQNTDLSHDYQLNEGLVSTINFQRNHQHTQQWLKSAMQRFYFCCHFIFQEIHAIYEINQECKKRPKHAHTHTHIEYVQIVLYH